MSVDDILKSRYGEWWDHKELVKAAPERWKESLARCRDALKYHNQKERPIEVLVVHGSSRSNHDLSCAHELSNSQLLLESGLDVLTAESDVSIERVNLREHNIEPCNNCVSTASSLCGFPCDCFPLDPMQELYPKVLACDVMLCSTGVNQAAMSSRLKTFLDRLISLDGGFLRPEWMIKDKEFRLRAIELARHEKFSYDQRMWGRVSAYFISSKDDKNPFDVDSGVKYVDMVARSLYVGQDSYGFSHPDPYYVSFVGKWDEEYCYDKQKLSEDTKAQNKAKELVKSAVELARKFRKSPPEKIPGRKNRT